MTRVFLTVLFNPLGKSHHDPIYQAIEMENMGVAKLKMLIPLVARKTFWNSGTVYRLDSNVTIMYRNDELSWLFTNKFSATRYKKI